MTARPRAAAPIRFLSKSSAVGAGKFSLQGGPDGDHEENEAEYHLSRNDQACIRASRIDARAVRAQWDGAGGIWGAESRSDW
jgi:hypothetical protein